MSRQGGAIRELKEELGIDVDPNDPQLVCTIKRDSRYTDNFINRQFDDVYLVRTKLRIEDMRYQSNELSDLFFVSYEQFKNMVLNHDPELLYYDDEYKIIIDKLDKELNP